MEIHSPDQTFNSCLDSAEGDGMRLLSHRRDKVCGVLVPKRRPQCRQVLRHPQRPVAGLEHQGENVSTSTRNNKDSVTKREKNNFFI